MKHIFTLLIMLAAGPLLSQSVPEFLHGTWKVQNKETYERWDKLNEHTLKGFSYKLENGRMHISEYLEISGKGGDLFYTASVVDQNQGAGIDFKLTESDSALVFENPDHDFPKKIVYQKLTDHDILVSVSDGKDQGFSFKMEKQNSEPTAADSTVSNPSYDSELAAKLGGDDYGMKSYILVLLKTGTNDTTDKEFISQCFRGHFENMQHMVSEGKLIVAGPIGKNENEYRGIFIIDAASFDEARALLQGDAAIKNELLEAELYNWYGSAALPEYLPAADKIWKVKP